MNAKNNSTNGNGTRAGQAWELSDLIDGEADLSTLGQRLFSQDASLYDERPLGVARPKHTRDLIALVRFAVDHHVSLIPRSGGTSLAGQCVGPGLVIDVSRYMRGISDLDLKARKVRVEPGVVQDDLNDVVAPHGLQFAPDTSTSRQAGIGGMIGNNSCGAYSILHGTTRDHVESIEAVLGDGSVAVFEPLDDKALERKRALDTLEGQIYRTVFETIDRHRDEILAHAPKPEVVRRNTGYALDRLAMSRPWNPEGRLFSLADLVCGSEGTLALVAAATVRLVPRPVKRLLLCAHFAGLQDAFEAARTTVAHRPAAVELMDGILLEATRTNREQAANRFWLEGTPGAVLAIEWHGTDENALTEQAHECEAALRAKGLGYAFPRIAEQDIPRVWALRKAGLGLLTGIPGDLKPVPAIEDAAVAVEDLPDYGREMIALLDRHDCRCACYGHASVGLLHFRPMLNLKTAEDQARFERILEDTAALVKRFRGSFSGEHGDGRLRAPYLRTVLSDEVYALMCRIKSAFDPAGIFNPGKIIDARPVHEALRWHPKSRTPEIETCFDWSRTQGFVRAAEACNGSAFCRQAAGRGTMCPTFMATGEEAHSTRGRANVLRQLLTEEDPEKAWTDPDLYTVLDTCISCKGCATECPSNVDLARMKAEVLQQRMDRIGVPLRSRLMGHYARFARMARFAPGLASWCINRRAAKRILGIAPQRKIPAYARRTLAAELRKHPRETPTDARPPVILFNDEFTNFTEPNIGWDVITVLEAFGRSVIVPEGLESGRTQISKGFLRDARRHMAHAVTLLAPWAKQGVPIVGIEPSAILGFRDEAPDLVPPELREDAQCVRDHCLLFEEFVVRAAEASPDNQPTWKDQGGMEVLLHGHCHQKALSGIGPAVQALRLIPGLQVRALASGCCGMAGSFGYEAEHYELSMAIGEQILFPAIRSAPDALVCASGTSCRHQIKDATSRTALHPAQILRHALS